MLDSSDARQVVFPLLLKNSPRYRRSHDVQGSQIIRLNLPSEEMVDQGPNRAPRPPNPRTTQSWQTNAGGNETQNWEEWRGNKEGWGSEKGQVSREIRRGTDAVFASISMLPSAGSTPLPWHKQGRAVPINVSDRGEKNHNLRFYMQLMAKTFLNGRLFLPFQINESEKQYSR